MRERLIELINQKQEAGWRFTGDEYITDVFNFELADHLLANGVIVPPCKVGDTVYFKSEYINEILSDEVENIRIQRAGITVCTGMDWKGYELQGNGMARRGMHGIAKAGECGDWICEGDATKRRPEKRKAMDRHSKAQQGTATRAADSRRFSGGIRERRDG